MLEITEGAKQALKELRSAKVEDSEAGLRLTMSSPGEFGLGIDTEREGDQVVEHEGSKILFIEGIMSFQIILA